MKVLLWLPVALVLQCHLSHSAENIFQDVISKKDMDEYGLALEAIFGIGLRLHALVDDSNSNFVVSPISATVIVGQLLLGAEGPFRDQLYDLLSLSGQPQHYNVHFFNKNKQNESCALSYAHIHLQLASLLKKLQKRKVGEQFTLKQNSALFYNRDIQLRTFFKNNMIRFYDSQITPLDFTTDTTSIINSWASLHTNGLIQTILPGPPGPSTSAIFLNSIYFKAKWETPFSDQLNVVDAFSTGETTKVITTFMQGMIESIPYAATKLYRMICLPYKNKELGMYIFLPNENNTSKFNSREFIKQLDPVEVLSTISKALIKDVIVKIPKLSLSNNLKLLEPLQKYAQFKKNAMKQSKVLDDAKDVVNVIDTIEQNVENFKNFTPEMTTDILLSGAAKGRNMLVSDIVQEVIFSINEEGTEAAAVSAGLTDYMGGSKTVVLDRPFTFFIRHEPTLATLFWGSITDPSMS